MHLVAVGFHLPQQDAPYLRQRGTAMRVIEVVSGLGQLGRRVIPIRRDDPVLDPAIIRYEYGQDPVRRQLQELDLPESGIFVPGHQYEAREVGYLRQDLGRSGEQRLGVGFGGQTRLDGTDGLFVQWLYRQQGIDEQPVPEPGGDPPGGRVRRVDQAHFFQIGHDIADRGRAQGQVRVACQSAGTNRLTLVDVKFD